MKKCSANINKFKFQRSLGGSPRTNLLEGLLLIALLLWRLLSLLLFGGLLDLAAVAVLLLPLLLHKVEAAKAQLLLEVRLDLLGLALVGLV